MSTVLDRLAEAVSRIEEHGDSVIVLLAGISEALTEANTDANPAIQAVIDRIDAQAQEFADAIVAYTPADPADPPVDPETPPTE